MYRILLTLFIFSSSLLRGMSSTQAEESQPLPTNPNNQFCYNLMQTIGSKNNLFISPYSIRTALAMVYAGAKANTANQMEEVLYFGQTDEFHSNFASTTKNISNVKYSKLQIANAMWIQKDYQLLASYQHILQKYYQTEAYKLNFADRTALQNSRKRINSWVEKQTENKIKNLIPPGVLQPTTRLVLTNAIYFLGNWQFPFDAKNNFHDNFYAPLNKQKVEFMRKELTINYAEGSGYQLVQIPYKRNELYLEIVLPKTKSSVSEVLQLLAVSKDEIPKPSSARVEVIMPKFKITKALNLRNILQEMGMTDVFGNNADLSGMNGKKDLYLSAVMHKAFVQVNETGTEAAAVTAAVVALKSAPPQKETVFRADRPFLFFIKHRKTNTILFSGVLQSIQ